MIASSRLNAGGEPVWDTMLRTVSGRHVDLLSPDWRSIVMSDVAYALAALPRWGGHRVRQISVLEHSLDVWAQAPRELKFEALLHDAHEAFLGDITRPVRRALAFYCADTRHSLEQIEVKLDIAIVRQAFAEAGAPSVDCRLEAETVVAAMRSPALARLEDESWGREAADPYGPKPKETIARLTERWLSAVNMECWKRYRPGV